MKINTWLTKNLRQEIRTVFEPRYNRKLSKNEVLEIGLGLTSYIENCAKFRWRKEYEKRILS